MLELTKCVFYHMPKTGGSWVFTALTSVCKVISSEEGHSSEKDHPKKDKIAFTFVRNPFSWYESVYHYERLLNDRRLYWIFSMYSFLPFYDFVDCMVSRHPGWLSNYIREFCGDKIDHIGKQESLQDDLLSILDNCKEPYRKDMIDLTERENVSIYKSVMTKEISYAIEKSEVWLKDKFYDGIKYV